MPTLLRGGTLLDGTVAAPRTNPGLLIEGERIAATGDEAELSAQPGATTYDCTGGTIMPGLIDCHDHMVHTNRDLDERSTRPLSLTMMMVAQNLRQTSNDRRRGGDDGEKSHVPRPRGTGLKAAIDAKVHSIEHGLLLGRTPDWLKQMADQGTFYVPTLRVLNLHRVQGTPWGKAKANAMYDDAARTLAAATKAGVKIAMGSDAGAYGHGRNGAEVMHLVEAGFTPMQAIVSGTRTASECLGMVANIGTLEVGKYADIIVVDGNPLADVSLLDGGAHLSLVLKGGITHVDKISAQSPLKVQV